MSLVIVVIITFLNTRYHAHAAILIMLELAQFYLFD